MLKTLPKPLFFGLLGMIGCLIGWAVGEPMLKIFSPRSQSASAGDAPPHAAPSLIFSNPVMQKVMTERNAHQGSIMIGLLWRNINDLDLHCVDPNGEEIYYGHKNSRSGGELDLDCNCQPPFINPGAEHIYWRAGQPPEGTYKVFVHHYNNKGAPDPTPFEVEILANGQRIQFSGSLFHNQNSEVREFTIPRQVADAPTIAAPDREVRFELSTITLVGFWGALLAIPLGMALVAGQNALQRRRLFNSKQTIGLLSGGLLAGFVSGAASEYLFASLAQKLGLLTNAFSLGVGQTFGWVILGALLGLAMAFFIPNLPRRFALLGGVAGGMIGGLIFVAAQHSLGLFIGRAIGSATLGFGIGTMIAIAESIAREAALIVHWGPNERSIINLGPKAVVLGSSPEADLYLPKEKGFPPQTALVTFKDGRIEIENKINNSRQQLRDGSRLQLGALTVEVQAK